MRTSGAKLCVQRPGHYSDRKSRLKWTTSRAWVSKINGDPINQSDKEISCFLFPLFLKSAAPLILCIADDTDWGYNQWCHCKCGTSWSERLTWIMFFFQMRILSRTVYMCKYNLIWVLFQWVEIYT